VTATTETLQPPSVLSVAAVRRSAHARTLWTLVGVGLAALAALCSVWLGSRGVSWSDVWAGLAGGRDTLGQAAVAKRLPRTVLALAAGGALGVSGAVMQGVTRNPLADPGILGVNMGASLAVAVGIVYFNLTNPTSYIWVAIVGSAAAAVFVYIVGSLGRGGATPLKLALAGAATSAALVSFVTAVVLPRNDVAGTFQSWQIGGVGGATWDKLATVSPFLAVGFVICTLSAHGLNSIALGDELAAGLGENVMLTRTLSALGAVVLCGATTAVCGPIAFVGLVVPHACRLVLGPDYRWIIPMSAITGATLVAVSDTVGRVIAKPQEVDVGIITAIVGAPVFIWIVRRQKVREL